MRADAHVACADVMPEAQQHVRSLHQQRLLLKRADSLLSVAFDTPTAACERSLLSTRRRHPVSSMLSRAGVAAAHLRSRPRPVPPLPCTGKQIGGLVECAPFKLTKEYVELLDGVGSAVRPRAGCTRWRLLLEVRVASQRMQRRCLSLLCAAPLLFCAITSFCRRLRESRRFRRSLPRRSLTRSCKATEGRSRCVENRPRLTARSRLLASAQAAHKKSLWPCGNSARVSTQCSSGIGAIRQPTLTYEAPIVGHTAYAAGTRLMQS
eukprot:6201825-Pleurochrysis_carterae.AAC.2